MFTIQALLTKDCLKWVQHIELFGKAQNWILQTETIHFRLVGQSASQISQQQITQKNTIITRHRLNIVKQI
jgi:hypothetical protein